MIGGFGYYQTKYANRHKVRLSNNGSKILKLIILVKMGAFSNISCWLIGYLLSIVVLVIFLIKLYFKKDPTLIIEEEEETNTSDEVSCHRGRKYVSEDETNYQTVASQENVPVFEKNNDHEPVSDMLLLSEDTELKIGTHSFKVQNRKIKRFKEKKFDETRQDCGLEKNGKTTSFKLTLCNLAILLTFLTGAFVYGLHSIYLILIY